MTLMERALFSFQRTSYGIHFPETLAPTTEMQECFKWQVRPLRLAFWLAKMLPRFFACVSFSRSLGIKKNSLLTIAFLFVYAQGCKPDAKPNTFYSRHPKQFRLMMLKRWAQSIVRLDWNARVMLLTDQTTEIPDFSTGETTPLARSLASQPARLWFAKRSSVARSAPDTLIHQIPIRSHLEQLRQGGCLILRSMLDDGLRIASGALSASCSYFARFEIVRCYRT